MAESMEKLSPNLPHNSISIMTGVVISTMASLAVVFCGVRIYVRKCILRTFGWDDVAVIVALISVLAFAAISLTITVYGAGRHVWDVDSADLLVFLKGYYAAVCSFLIVSLFVKCSLVMFLMRVFPYELLQTIGKWLIGFMILFTISGEFPLAFRCAPLEAAYDLTIEDRTCFSEHTMFAIAMYQSVVMFVTNFIICTLPMVPLWRLKLSLQKRIAVISICILGIGVTVVSLVRFIMLAFGPDQADVTYYIASTILWVNLEFCLGVVASSVPSLGTIFRKPAEQSYIDSES